MSSILDRHLVYAGQFGLTPIICLTKADLVAPKLWQERLKPTEELGCLTVATSAAKGSQTGKHTTTWSEAIRLDADT